MSIIDAIEYDLDALNQMSTNELLVQLICHRHLDRPKRSGQIRAKKAYEAIVTATEGYIADVAKLGVTPLSDALESALAEYVGTVKATT